MLALVACYNPFAQSLIHMLIRFMRQFSMQSKAFLNVSENSDTPHFARKLSVMYVLIVRRL